MKVLVGESSVGRVAQPLARDDWRSARYWWLLLAPLLPSETVWTVETDRRRGNVETEGA